MTDTAMVTPPDGFQLEGVTPPDGFQLEHASTWGQSIRDVGKQIVPALAEGVAGVGGAYTDLSNLAGTGLIKGLHALGVPGTEILSPEEAARLKELFTPSPRKPGEFRMPGDVPAPPGSQQILDKMTPALGPFPDPQTKLGEYTRTVGSFVPGALTGEAANAPALLRNLIKWGIIPGVTSETAGQVTKGTAAEGPARLAASVISPVLGGRVATPLPLHDAPHAANIAALADEGVQATAGQATARRPLQYLEAQLSSDRNEAQQGQITRAALGRVGINADRLVPGAGGTVDTMLSNIGGRFDRLQAANDMRVDAPLVHDLNQVHQTYLGTPGLYGADTENAVHGALTRAANVARAGGGTIGGEDYQTLRSNLSAAARGSSDPQRARALGEIVESLDDAMGRSVARTNPNAAGEWDQARRDYRNALVIEKAAGMAGPETAGGNLTPANLASAAKAVYGKRVYLRGQDDFSGLTQPAVSSLPKLPDSGTAHRAAISGALAAIGGGAGYAIGSHYNSNPEGGNESPIAGLLLAEGGAGAAAARLLGRPAVMNPVTQRYLRNQQMTNTPGLLSVPGAITAANGARGLLSPGQ